MELNICKHGKCQLSLGVNDPKFIHFDFSMAVYTGGGSIPRDIAVCVKSQDFTHFSTSFNDQY